MLKLIPSWFIRYKFFNSLFLGLSVGAIFTLYAPLEPSIYSLGGVLLAVAMLIVARFYHTILNAKWFFRISLFVELVLLLAMLYFLYASYNYQTALIHLCFWLLSHKSGNTFTQDWHTFNQTRYSKTAGVSFWHGLLLSFLQDPYILRYRR